MTNFITKCFSLWVLNYQNGRDCAVNHLCGSLHKLVIQKLHKPYENTLYLWNSWLNVWACHPKTASIIWKYIASMESCLRGRKCIVPKNVWTGIILTIFHHTVLSSSNAVVGLQCGQHFFVARVSADDTKLAHCGVQWKWKLSSTIATAVGTQAIMQCSLVLQKSSRCNAS